MASELTETDHDVALREKLRAYTVEALLKDELGQEELLKVKAREEEIKNIVERAKLDLEIARTRETGFVRTDVEVDKLVRTGKANNEIRSGEIENELRRLTGLRAIDRDIDETKMKARAQEFDKSKGASIEELIATANDPEKMRALVELAKVNAQKAMSADQLLGQAAATSEAAANAFAAKSVSEKETMSRLVEEIKKLVGENSAKDERLLAQLAQVMGRAAERPDAPPPPATQQIIK